MTDEVTNALAAKVIGDEPAVITGRDDHLTIGREGVGAMLVPIGRVPLDRNLLLPILFHVKNGVLSKGATLAVSKFKCSVLGDTAEPIRHEWLRKFLRQTKHLRRPSQMRVGPITVVPGAEPVG